ncbi:hypothetical protein Slin15195_G080440 [Septoria linicola]|uniref:Uncharacterized protein n=1 Tax=Septoria linicola TaxID=215465 RepID=A0A9Q9AT90_9PEZI|nr:hypothetical protein Slin14017_G041620 [Septoria linicola]USW54725.1 hypothetical protein Slin15195_G080440 [Septoria linicola]
MAPHHAPHMRAKQKAIDDAAAQSNGWSSSDAWADSAYMGTQHRQPVPIDSRTANALAVQEAILWQNGRGLPADRKLVFMEGNYDLPLARVKSVLEPLELWDVACRAAVTDEDSSKDKNALYILHHFVDRHFCQKWDISLYSSSFEILKKVEAGCKPFRLMDLPQEVVETIGEYIGASLIDSTKDKPMKIYNAIAGGAQYFESHKVRSTKTASPPFKSRSVHSLVSVSRDLRDTFTKAYFAENHFALNYRCSVWEPQCDNISNMLEMVTDLGMKYLKHVRSFQVAVGLQKGTFYATSFHELRISFDDKSGLKCCHRRCRVDMLSILVGPGVVQPFELPEFVELTELTLFMERNR